MIEQAYPDRHVSWCHHHEALVPLLTAAETFF